VRDREPIGDCEDFHLHFCEGQSRGVERARDLGSSQVLRGEVKPTQIGILDRAPMYRRIEMGPESMNHFRMDGCPFQGFSVANMRVSLVVQEVG
jgi:hypothetical protein